MTTMVTTDTITTTTTITIIPIIKPMSVDSLGLGIGRSIRLGEGVGWVVIIEGS